MNKSDLWAQFITQLIGTFIAWAVVYAMAGGTDLHEPFFFHGVLVAVVLNLIMSIHVINNKETTTS